MKEAEDEGIQPTEVSREEFTRIRQECLNSQAKLKDSLRENEKELREITLQMKADERLMRSFNNLVKGR